MATDRDDESAARFDDVAFAYERGAELPDAEAEIELKDPDARGGAVLRGIDLAIPDGSFTVVMGASGGGKSTLVRCLNAIVPKHYRGSFRGNVDVFGQRASQADIAEMARLTGMVMQDYEAQLFGTSIESEVAFGPENLNVPAEEIGDRIERVLDIVDLADLNRRRPPAGLSGGQKQRLVFASVLATYPELLILDEPTSDLDPRGTRELLEVVQRLMETDGSDAVTDGVPGWDGPETFVMVTHKIEEAVLADHVVLLRGGRVYKSGPAREIFTDVAALEEARVAVPPLVRAFDRLGVEQADLPIVPQEARELVAETGLTWTPPARHGESVGHPAGTGRDPGEVIFEADGLTKEYKTDRETIVAVDDVDMTVREGEFVAIVGHNGSGKTTFAKHLNGLLTAEQGTVRWEGRDVRDVAASEIGRHVGFVFQNPDHQLFEKTVREELEFGPRNFGYSGEELDRQVEQAIETVELGQLVDSDPFNLSKGQRQRVALGSILAVDPEVIIFDEPTTGLDAPQARRFMDLVAQLNREDDMTVVMVTHDMQSVARYAPRTVVLSEGRKVADTDTRELFADQAALEEWELTAPQQVQLSNELAADAGLDDALPALDLDELVEGLGGDGAYAGEGS